MAIAPRNSRRSSIDIWPGFVDALAQLLMVIIFILLVFTAGQFYLSEALSGRDQALQQLQQQVNELGDLLALERRAKEELRVSSADLSAQLASSQAERDRLSGQLRDADAVVSADKEKIELQLSQIESLQRDLEALKTVRADLEAKVAALAQQQAPQNLGALRDRTKELEARLAAEQERTSLAQKEIDARDIRLRELGSRAGARRREGDQPQRARPCRPAQRAARGVARAIVAHRLGPRRLRSQGQGAAGPDRRTRQAAQSGARQQGRGTCALPLRVFRPAARGSRRPAGYSRRRRPLRVPVRSAVRAGKRRAQRRCQAGAGAGDRRAEGDCRQDTAGHQLDPAGGWTHRPPADQQSSVSVELGIIDRPRVIGRTACHRRRDPSGAARRGGVRRQAADRSAEHRGCLSAQSAHRAEADRTVAVEPGSFPITLARPLPDPRCIGTKSRTETRHAPRNGPSYSHGLCRAPAVGVGDGTDIPAIFSECR